LKEVADIIYKDEAKAEIRMYAKTSRLPLTNYYQSKPTNNYITILKGNLTIWEDLTEDGIPLLK